MKNKRGREKNIGERIKEVIIKNTRYQGTYLVFPFR